jgi:hypothetical protein
MDWPSMFKQRFQNDKQYAKDVRLGIKEEDDYMQRYVNANESSHAHTL